MLPAQPQNTDIAHISKKEFKQLLKDCDKVEVPANIGDRHMDDVAIDLANARKQALEECTARLRKARAKLDGHN